MEINNEFFKELDIVIREELNKLIQLIEGTKITKFTFEITLSNDNLKKFKLSEDFIFLVDSTPTSCEVKYYYKNLPLEPINYYLRPDDYHEVSTLEMLQQCVLQDTHQPDIRFLERGEKINKN